MHKMVEKAISDGNANRDDCDDQKRTTTPSPEETE